jgi:hypothetical protein
MSLRLPPRLVTLAAVAALATASPSGFAETDSRKECQAVTIPSHIDLTDKELTLADLLPPGTCPEWQRAAATMHLGSTPLAGGVRIVAGETARALLEKLPAAARRSIAVPERITIQGSDDAASCAEISEKVLAELPGLGARVSPAPVIDCTAVHIPRVPRQAQLAVLRTVWDRGLRAWDITVHCVGASACLPFLLRLRAAAEGSETPISGLGGKRNLAATLPPAQPLVRPGKGATLDWEEAGIRLVVPVVCLDKGGLGQTVRVRVAGSGRVLAAVVAGDDQVRAVPVPPSRKASDVSSEKNTEAVRRMRGQTGP